MAAKLPTGITDRVNASSGRKRRQYRAHVSDPSQRTDAGRSRQVSSRWFDTLSEAREWREEKIAEIKTMGGLAAQGGINVNEAFDEWLKAAKTVGIDGRSPVEGATSERYASTMRNVIKPSIGLIPIGDLSAPKVLRWRDQMVEKHGHDAAGRALAVLKQMLNYHTSIGNIRANPAASVKIARSAAKASRGDEEDGEGPVEEFMAPDDVRRLLEAVDRIAATGALASDSGRGLGDFQRKQRVDSWAWARPLIYLLVLGGTRMGEAAALQWGDVNWEEATVSIRRARKRDGKIGAPKNRTSVRSIAMGKQFMGLLRQLYVARNDRELQHYVFGGDPKKPLNVRNFAERQWKPLMVECAMVDHVDGKPVNRWTPHDCRHYHASSLIMSGMNDQLVAERLGHANTTVTLTVYAHLFHELRGRANRAGAELEGVLMGRSLGRAEVLS